MVRPSAQARDDFEEFVVEVPMLLEDLQDLLRDSRGYRGVKVEFDDESLDRVEAFYLDVLAGKETVGVSTARMERIIIAYFGEAMIERAGGRWALNEFRGDPSFGTPVIIDWAENATRFSPVERRELMKENRKPFLRDLIAYAANKEQFEEDFFKEFE